MSRARGISKEEKLTRVNDFFHETKPFTLKECESKISKAKGINANLVKDLCGELIADNLVQSDKIGLSNYYWAFPSNALIQKQVRLTALEEDVSTKKRKIEEISANLITEKEGRVDTEERPQKIKKLQELKKQNSEITEELKQFADNDPELLKDYELDAKTAFESVNRWTDNIFQIQSWANKKFMINEADFRKNFLDNKELEYLE